MSKPLPSPGDLPKPGIKPASPALQVKSLPLKPVKKKKMGYRKISIKERSVIAKSTPVYWRLKCEIAITIEI